MSTLSLKFLLPACLKVRSPSFRRFFSGRRARVNSEPWDESCVTFPPSGLVVSIVSLAGSNLGKRVCHLPVRYHRRVACQWSRQRVFLFPYRLKLYQKS